MKKTPNAYSVGIYMQDDDFLEGVNKGDLFIFLEDTPENRALQSELLLNRFKNNINQ